MPRTARLAVGLGGPAGETTDFDADHKFSQLERMLLTAAVCTQRCQHPPQAERCCWGGVPTPPAAERCCWGGGSDPPAAERAAGGGSAMGLGVQGGGTEQCAAAPAEVSAHDNEEGATVLLIRFAPEVLEREKRQA